MGPAVSLVVRETRVLAPLNESPGLPATGNGCDRSVSTRRSCSKSLEMVRLDALASVAIGR